MANFGQIQGNIWYQYFSFIPPGRGQPHGGYQDDRQHYSVFMEEIHGWYTD